MVFLFFCLIVYNNIRVNKEIYVEIGYVNVLFFFFEIRDGSWNYNNVILLFIVNGSWEFYKECLFWCRDIVVFYKIRDINVFIFFKKLLDKIICYIFFLRYFMLCVVFNSFIYKWNNLGGEKMNIIL